MNDNDMPDITSTGKKTGQKIRKPWTTWSHWERKHQEAYSDRNARIGLRKVRLILGAADIFAGLFLAAVSVLLLTLRGGSHAPKYHLVDILGPVGVIVSSAFLFAMGVGGLVRREGHRQRWLDTAELVYCRGGLLLYATCAVVLVAIWASGHENWHQWVMAFIFAKGFWVPLALEHNAVRLMEKDARDGECAT